MNRVLKIVLPLFIALCLCSTGKLLAQDGRSVMSLNGQWRFLVDSLNVGVKQNWGSGLRGKNPVPVTVPHTWNVMTGYENYNGLAWYEKTFSLPSSWKNKQVRIKFGAVYHDAVIYLNGVKVSEHLNSGYTSFYVDITKYVKQSGANALVVSVSNAYSSTNLPYKRSFDWVNDGGIIRDVEIIASDKPSIRYLHISPQISFADTTAKAAVRIKLWEDDVEEIDGTLVISEKKSQRNIYNGKMRLKRSGDAFVTTIDLGKVHLWHFNDPFLYEAKLSLNKNGKQTDHINTRFGVREIRLDGNKFLLNGEMVRLPGMEYMPSSHPAYGSAEPHWVMDSVVNMFKDLNVTISRFHWQVDEYMLNLMDEKGILLQAEIPWWQQPGKLTPELVATAKQQLNEMTERDYNHPCIFAWGISNEVYGNDRDSNQYVFLRDYIKGLDSSRLVTVVSNETFKRKRSDESFITDLPTWNEYIGTWFGKSNDELPAYFKEIESFIGNKPLLITENGLCEPRFAGGDLRRIQDMNYHYSEWAKRDYIVGCIYFCLNDYRTHMGEDGAGKFKARIHGIADLYLKKKPSYYVFKQLASPVQINNVKKINNSTIEVTLFNKDNLPSYTLRGCRLRWTTTSGKTQEKELPIMKPGDTVRLQVENVEPRYSFDVITANGFCMTSYPFAH